MDHSPTQRKICVLGAEFPNSGPRWARFYVEDNGVVDLLDGGEALQHITKYLRTKFDLLPYFTNGAEQPDDGPLGGLGKMLKYVRIEDKSTETEVRIG